MGLNDRLIDSNAIYVAEADISAPVVSEVLRSGAGGQHGATHIVLRAKTDVTLADTKQILLGLLEANAENGTFVKTLEAVVTASGATVYSAGAIIAELVIPRTSKEFTKVSFTTDDAAATGKIEAFCSTPLGFSNV